MKEVLKSIKPSEKEEKKLKSKLDKFLSKLKDCKEEIFIGGSYAKGTWLSGNHDIDLFVQFKQDVDISNRLEKILKNSFRKVSRLHGSRDYYQIKFKGILFEIVPVAKIKKAEEANNTTDVSPLHVEWVKKNTTKKLCDEIRLAKQFCKAQGVYGAETYIKGFSGHALEILTIKLGSFKKLLKSNFKEGKQIGKGKINKDKLSPLILIDPSDNTRNAAAALSIEKFNKFKEAAKQYLKKPSKEFFKEKGITKKDIKDKDIIITAYPLKGKRDNIGTKLLKAYELTSKVLKEFKVEDSGWHWEERKPALFWFNLKEKELKKFKIHPGPPLTKIKHVKEFKNKHKFTFTKNNKLYAKVEREFTTPKALLKYLLKQKDIKKRVRKIKLSKS